MNSLDVTIFSSVNAALSVAHPVNIAAAAAAANAVAFMGFILYISAAENQ